MNKRMLALFALVIGTGLLGAPMVASANCEPTTAPDVHVGDLVKIPGRSTVFYIADNGLRYNFPNNGVYQSWFGNDFSKVKTISQARFNMIPMGGYVMYRPGTKLVKFATSNDVYAITKNNELRRLANPSVARALFGANWNRKVETLPANFRGAMKLGPDVKSADDFSYATQIKPVEITFTVPLNMVVIR